MAGVFSQLLDAVVDGIEPMIGRFAGGRRLVVVERDNRLAFFEVARGRANLIAEGADIDERQRRRVRRAARGPVELRLPPERLISRSLQLPAAGREYLDPIIEHRLERLTPWRPDRVVYGYAVAGETGEAGTIAVDFLATSAEIAADAEARLSALKLAPTALGSAAEAVDTPLAIDLYRGSRDVGRRRLRRFVGFAAVIAGLLLVPAAAGSAALAWFADDRLATLETRLATKRNVIRSASGASEAESRDLDLIKAKSPETAVVLLVDRVARILPDDTYLREIELEGARLRLAGFSTDASQLIGLLDADEALADVRFAAPVTRDERGRDAFDIVAEWSPRAVAPADPNAPPPAPAGDGLP